MRAADLSPHEPLGPDGAEGNRSSALSLRTANPLLGSQTPRAAQPPPVSRAGHRGNGRTGGGWSAMAANFKIKSMKKLVTARTERDPS